MTGVASAPNPVRVTAIRTLFAQRHLAVLICAAALLVKLIVPAGFMVGQVDGHAAIILCPGSGPVPPALVARHEAMAMPGQAAMHHGMGDHPDHSDDTHGRDMPCAFAGLAAPGLAAVDPIQLALLLVFILALGVAQATTPPPCAAPYLRPPLRGPPSLS